MAITGSEVGDLVGAFVGAFVGSAMGGRVGSFVGNVVGFGIIDNGYFRLLEQLRLHSIR